MTIDRRQFLKLTALGGGAVFASSLPGCAALGGSAQDDFYFVQLSDTHWGFNGPIVNPDARGTLPKAIAAVNALDIPPDFVVFTGDLTHTTDDGDERRKRLREFKEVAFSAVNCSRPHAAEAQHPTTIPAPRSPERWRGPCDGQT